MFCDTYELRIINKTIYFYEDSSPTGVYLRWIDNDDTFYISDSITVQSGVISYGNVYSNADIFTTGSGDNIWAGTSTEASSSSWIGADGTARFNGTSGITVNRINIYNASTYVTSNGTCMFFVTPTANLSVGC